MISKKLSSLTLIAALSILLISCSSSGDNSFTITNSSEIDRTDEPIVITRNTLENRLNSISDDKIPVPFYNNQPLASQVDDIDNDGIWDELAFILDIKSDESKEVTISLMNENEVPHFEQRTNVRFGVKNGDTIEDVEDLVMTADELPAPLYTRFQMDGPAWENDKAGFRQYIDGRNGQDFFGKTSSEMALEHVGISDEGELVDNYHVMLPWGRDILGVGNSTGLGGLSLLKNGTPVRLGVRMDADRNNVETTHFQLLAEGPVRSMFRLDYKGWDIGEEQIDISNTVTIWAGKYGYESVIELNGTGASDTLLVGLVNIHNDEEPVLEDGNATDYNLFFTHDKQTYDKGWYLGMGLIVQSENFVTFTEAPNSGPGITNTYLLQFDLNGSNKELEYYVFAGWELSDENFADRAYFQQFMQSELQKIAQPVQVD